MNKTLVLEAFVAQMRSEVSVLQGSLEEVCACGSDSESKSEGKYDTRAIETGYLAEGQARHLEGLVRVLAYLERMLFTWQEDPRGAKMIKAGCLFSLVLSENEVEWYVLVACDGGNQVELEGVKVTLLSVMSPLGKSVLTRSVGEVVDGMRVGVIQ